MQPLVKLGFEGQSSHVIERHSKQSNTVESRQYDQLRAMKLWWD